MKVEMKNTDYYKSGQHKANAQKAGKKALAALSRIKQKKLEDYSKNPSKCTNCDTSLDYDKRKNKFCSKSCSASYNNRNRVRSSETNEKISKALSSYYKENYKTYKKQFNQNLKEKQFKEGAFCKVFTITCRICGTQHAVRFTKKDRKTCGKRACKIHASVGERTYQNGSRKPVWYFNPYEAKKVLLESSWEVEIANYLIDKNIKWIRPKPVQWLDPKGVERYYYPDFYLPDYNLYLDPKNPYCMSKDRKKLEIVKLKINLKYGAIEYIKEVINSLLL
jgi:hypothetical protein